MVKASAAAVHSSLQQGRRTGRSKSFPILTKIILVVAVFAIVRTINVWVFPDDPVDGIVTTSSSNGINWEQMAKSSNKQSNEFTSVESTQSEEPRQVRHDGFLGSPRSKLIQQPGATNGDCDCDLLSIDCLHSIACIAENDEEHILEGILKRRALKDSLAGVWDVPLGDGYDWAPLGKTLQSLSVKLWREFLTNNQLPPAMYGNKLESFVNASYYPFCSKNGLVGKPCYFADFDAPEEYGELETKAIEYGRSSGSSTPDILAAATKELQAMRERPDLMTPHTYLLGFSHLSKITFHLRRHMMDIYQKRVKTIEATVGNVDDDGPSVLRVGLHVRRGDACTHELTNYDRRPSPLDSGAQLSGIRKCYKTAVYIRALERVQELAGSHRHLVVYVATDHMLSLLDEIKEAHAKVFDSMTWKYVDYPRNMFNYSQDLLPGSNYIEWAPNKALLGETAIVDVHHLSHAQVFVGHLGSRFGKLSWWQATGRHNAFVPFFSVDGHSICCDIDEACGAISPSVVSMENCLAFNREDHQSKYVNDPDSYWKNGATVRFQAAADEVGGRKAAAKMKQREKESLADHADDFRKVPPLLAKVLDDIEKEQKS